MAATLQLLTPSQVDELLCVTSGRAVRLAKAGKIPHIKLPSGEYRFDPDEIAAWLRERSCKAEAHAVAATEISGGVTAK